jgi:hypothetical protein
MDNLKSLIQRYRRWALLETYIARIEGFRSSDFSISLENAKALLETIGKEICDSKGIILEPTASINAILKKAFIAIGYQKESVVTQISSALATIGQKIGELRNEIGATVHGRSLDELKARNDNVDEFTRGFLINTTSLIACFLITAFETEQPRTPLQQEVKILLDDNEEFNEFWDETYGDFSMGDYSYPASEIFYNVDYAAYLQEQKAFAESEKDL